MHYMGIPSQWKFAYILTYPTHKKYSSELIFVIFAS